MLLFLEGDSPSINEAIIYELHGHTPYLSRKPNPKSGEMGMTIVEDGVVVARGNVGVYDYAHDLHRLHARNKIRVQDGLKPVSLLRQKTPVGA
jgi:hypothetical protein